MCWKALPANRWSWSRNRERNKLYFPVEPDIFIQTLKSRYKDLFSNISQFAHKLYTAQKKDDKLVVIKGRQNILDFLNVLIKGAKKRIALSIWEAEIKEIDVQLKKAVERGVVLRGIYFGKDAPYKSLVPHRRLERYIAEKKQRYLSVIIDGKHTISGLVSRGEDSKVTWTRDEGFIEVSEDYIAHDLVVNLYSASLDKKAYERFEEFSDNVQREYFNYSDEKFSTYKNLK